MFLSILGFFWKGPVVLFLWLGHVNLVRSSKRRFVLGRLFHGSASHLQCLECLECLDKKTMPRRLAKTFPTLQPGLAFLTAMRSKDPSTQDTTTRVARAARVACFFDKNWCKWSEAKIGKAMCETFKVWSTPGRSLHRQRPKSHHWSRCIGQSCKVSVAEYDIWLFLQWKIDKHSRLQWYAKQLPEWRSSLGKEVYFRLGRKILAGKLSQLSK